MVMLLAGYRLGSWEAAFVVVVVGALEVVVTGALVRLVALLTEEAVLSPADSVCERVLAVSVAAEVSGKLV